VKALFAMDLIGGKCVRLQKGDFSKVTVYSEDPVAKVEEMIQGGARDFHIIDLDGARTGKRVHHEIMRDIRSRVKGYMEVGGGIRDASDIAYYSESLMDGIIVGTRALEDPDFFEGLAIFRNIVLGLDLYGGRPMVRGWKTALDRDIKDIIKAAERIGVMAILCTSIERDGMLTGPDYDGMKRLLAMTRLPLIASGGVSDIDDVKRLKDLNVWAAIIGKAVYEGKVKVEEAIRYAD
jgi:phosphoribosylformimino-5-aminoimidazole carboxamide ribotide isomerase